MSQFTPKYGDPDNTLLFKIAGAVAAGGGGGGGGGSGVSSFNSRTGDVSLLSGDVTGALGFTPENVANKDTDGTLAANSDTRYASQKATKTYADTKLSLSGGILSGDLDLGTGIHLDTDGSAMFGTGALTISAAGILSAPGNTFSITPSSGAASFATGQFSITSGGAIISSQGASFGSGTLQLGSTGDLSFTGTTHAGLLLNQLTTTQRDALTPTVGMVIYNTTTGRVNAYEGSSWHSSWVLRDGDSMSGDLSFGGSSHVGLKLNRMSTASRNAITITEGGNLIWNINTNHAEFTNQALGWQTIPKLEGDTFTGQINFSGTTHAGLKLNNLTTTQRDALTGADGMFIFNSTDARVQEFSGGVWYSMVRLVGDTMTGTLTLSPAANTSALVSTAGSITGAGITTLFDLGGTWNTSGSPTAWRLNITNTASGANALLADWQVGSASKFSIAPVGKATVTQLAIGSGSADGMVITNTTAAAAGAQQNSPALRLTGQGWRTNATAQSEAVDFRIYVQPTQGSADPSGALSFDFAVNGGAFSNRFQITSSGNANATGNYSAGAAANFNWSGRSRLSSSADGLIELTNSAQTDFTRLNFGGTTASFPSIKRNSTGLDLRLADDSGYTTLTLGKNGVGSTPADGITVTNTTAAAAGAQQYSPAIRLTGQGWRTNATAQSEAVDWRIYVQPIQGAADPTASLLMDCSINGGAFTNRFTMTSGGSITIVGSFTVDNAAAYQWTGRSFISSPADGNLKLGNNAGTGFGLLQFGGTTSSYPALKRSTTFLHFRLADDSGYTGFIAGIGANKVEEIDGTGLGFFGATPAVQQTSGANLTNNVTSGGTTDQIDNFTDLTIYANDAAAIRNDIYQLARKLKQVNDALRTYGLLT